MDYSAAHSFGAVFNENSRILILGTMPSVQSRAAGFYYAHPRNRFWLVLSESFCQPAPQNVYEKKLLLLSNGVALWDVLSSCSIIGSSDSSIRDPVYNDIASLVRNVPIEKILCNGKKAFSLYKGFFNLRLPVICMPSTSPANAAWSVERLATAWKPELLMF